LKFCGVALIDLRNNNQDDHIKVLEINPRYWGSLIGALSAGVNFLYFACLSGLGIPFDHPDYIHKIT
jgi:predicted ATP-grasp superfamily ATP-dependent carboligase